MLKKIFYNNITIDGNVNLFSNQQVLCVYPSPGAPKKIGERVFFFFFEGAGRMYTGYRQDVILASWKYEVNVDICGISKLIIWFPFC